MTGEPGIACRSCGYNNPAHSRFCGSCGMSLAVKTTCVSCGAEVPAGSKFCNQCGTPVGPQHDGPERAQTTLAVPEDLAGKIDAGRASLEGERKQITVLFADVVGSMDLAEKLDPESWRELMNRFFQVLADAVHHADGTAEIWPAPPRAVIASPISSARRSATVIPAARMSTTSSAHRFRRCRRVVGTTLGRSLRAA